MTGMVTMKWCLGLAMTFMCQLAIGNSSFGTQNVSAVTVHDSGYLMITLEAASHTESCADSDRTHSLILNPDSPHLAEMYSTALAAYMSGKRLYGWVNGCIVVWGKYSYPKATVISVRQVQ